MDSLATIGAPVSNDDHIEVILDGLSEEYAPLITIVMSRLQPFSIDELEALLMAQEEMLERFKKADLGLLQANLARNLITTGKGNGGRRGRGRSRGGGRSWQGCRPQCQLCGKIGHIVWQCFYRFN